jgi:hypothetical protein
MVKELFFIQTFLLEIDQQTRMVRRDYRKEGKVDLSAESNHRNAYHRNKLFRQCSGACDGKRAVKSS